MSMVVRRICTTNRFFLLCQTDVTEGQSPTSQCQSDVTTIVMAARRICEVTSLCHESDTASLHLRQVAHLCTGYYKRDVCERNFRVGAIKAKLC